MEFHEKVEFRVNAPKPSNLMKTTDFRGLGLENTLPTLQFNCCFRVGCGTPRNYWTFMKLHGC